MMLSVTLILVSILLWLDCDAATPKPVVAFLLKAMIVWIVLTQLVHHYLACKSAGIGVNAGAIRAIGSPVRNGDTSHRCYLTKYPKRSKVCSPAVCQHCIIHLAFRSRRYFSNPKQQGTEDNEAHRLWCAV